MRRLEHILPAWAQQDIGVIGARLFQALGSESGRKDARGAETSEELTLVVSVSDVGYRLVMLDRAGVVRSDIRRWLCVDQPNAGPAAALAHAATSAPRGAPLLEENIGGVVLLVDDPALHLTDHRAARLSNFEPRALRQFGVQQAGGKPVVFNSRAYGETGGKELERRVIAYLPEDRLESLFFPLGVRATALKAVVPAAAPALDAATEPVMALRVHGYFSTITLATPQSGVITSRQIPLGALSAAARYGAAFGMPLDQACAAMAERARFAPVEAVLADIAPAEYATASFAALAPFLQAFYGEIEATLDYYQFERYADRPARLDLAFTGPTLAGLDHWLGEALDMPAAIAAPTPATALGAHPDLNLLENVRPGLLKIGAEPFQFEDGAFRPADPPRNRRSAGRPGSAKAGEQRASLAALFRGKDKDKDSDAPARPAWLAPAFFACAAPALLVLLNMNFLIGPARKDLDRRANAYATLLQETAPAPALAPVAALRPDEPGAGWARNMVSLGAAMLPGMEVTGVALDSGDTEDGLPKLTIEGVMPQAAGGDLRLIAGFIDRLGKDAALGAAFPRVEFAGVSPAPEQRGTAQASGGAVFRVVAVSARAGNPEAAQ